MPTYRTILTDLGIALEADAAANSTPIVLTEMAVGDGNGNPVTPDSAQTFLARERYRDALNLLTVNPANPSQFIAELVIPAIEGGFVLREVGLFTSDGDLFAVANLPDTYKPTSDEGAYSDTVVRMIFEVQNASVVTLVIDPNVTIATRTWVLNNITAAQLIPGGLTDQVLAKETNADGDFKWIDPTAAVEVIVHSREETQTLAAAQTVVDLAILTSEGTAVYIEGVRLRGDQFSVTGAAQITLAASYPADTKVTVVQNEEVGGSTDFMRRANNLSDVENAATARTNLGLPTWIGTVSIAWSQLTGLPAYATRWPTWGEVTDKPTTFAPSAHTHTWANITDPPATATRWPTWTEVTGKPGTFTPSAHLHVIDNVTGLQGALDSKANLLGATFTGSIRAPFVGAGAGPDAPLDVLAASNGRLMVRATGANTRIDAVNATDTAFMPLYLTATSFNFGVGPVTASAFAQSSSRRYKRDIKSISPRQALRLLSTVRFTEYTVRADGARAMGVIAEELADGPLDFAVIRTASGEPEAVNYQPLFVLACTALQGLADDLEELKAAKNG